VRVTKALPLAALAAAALTGCGSGGDDGLPPRPLVAAIGDSITAGAPLWDPDPKLRAAIEEPDEQSQYEHWAARRLGVRFRNCGVSGQTTDEIAPRLDACLRGARMVIVQGGLNDLVLERTPEHAAANLRAMVVRAKAAGVRVVLAELIPWNGDAGAAPRIAALNRLIAGIGRDEHVRVLPFHRVLEDPADRTRMRDDLTDDDIHPSVEGYQRLSEVIPAP